MTECDDAKLMLRYAAGDAMAFHELYERHKDSVYRYLLRLTGNAAGAEDVAQEVWTKIIASRRRYRADARFTTFLYRVAYNAWIDSGRRNRYAVRHDCYDDERMQDGAGSAAEAVDAAALRATFLAALAALPDEQRNAYLLHEEAGLSVAAVARVTGTVPETAKSRIRYAVKKLKSVLLQSQYEGVTRR
ncbi:MAG: sigma-70 family RNA polymerase sigma factor [Pseudomonadota bacterium]